MRGVFLGIMIAVEAGIAAYFYFYLKRAVSFLSGRPAGWPGRIAAGVLAVSAAFLSANIWSVWALLILHLFAFSLCADLLAFVLKQAGRRGRRLENLWRSGVIPVLCTALMMGYGYWNMNQVVRTDYLVETDKEIREEGYRIAMISDLHYGTTMDAAGLKANAAGIEAAGPDLVVLCGDIVDEGTTKAQMEEAMEVLGSIESPLGVWFVHGNHDKTRYRQNPNFSVEELETAIRASGIGILNDERVELTGDFTVIGRDDRSFPKDGSRKPVEELAAGADQEDFLLLLDHQPCELEAVDRSGCDLMLSGHTHAGQIWPTGLISQGLGIVEQNYGWRQMDHLQVIVSSGIAGWGYPVRTSRHCEYVVVEVRQSRAE